MRQALLAAVLLIAGLAGCIGTDEPLEATNATSPAADPAVNASVPTLPDGSPARTSFTQTQCEETIASFPVPSDDVEPWLPEGFEPATIEAGMASVSVATFDCAIDRGERVTQHEIGLFVEPPDRYHVRWADGTFVELARVVDGGSLADTLQAWGFSEVVPGNANIDVTATPLAETGATTASDEDRFDIAYETSVPQDPQPEGDGSAFEALFLGVQDAEVVGTAKVVLGPGGTTSETGTAVLTTAQTPFDFLQAGMEGLAIHAYSGDEPTTYTYLDDPRGGEGGGSR